jgi:hypothetical protein
MFLSSFFATTTMVSECGFGMVRGVSPSMMRIVADPSEATRGAA